MNFGKVRKYADYIFVNGDILTMEDENPYAEAVAVCDRQIIFVGNKEEAMTYRDNQTELIDLNGKTLIPGIIESHSHPIGFVEQCLSIRLTGEATASQRNLLAKMAVAAETTPKGKLLYGWGWDEGKFEEGPKYVTRAQLDEVAPEHPVFIRRICGHGGMLNTYAMKLYGINRDTPVPAGGDIIKDDNGEPTGYIMGGAIKLLNIPPSSREKLYNTYVTIVQDEYLSLGITSIADMACVPSDISLYQDMLNNGDLKVRMRYWPIARSLDCSITAKPELLGTLGIKSGLGNDMLRFMGAKFQLDGSVGCRTAALSRPYDDSSNCGVLYYEHTEELISEVVYAIENGLRVAMHAIGDRAIDVAIACYEEAAKHFDINKMRNRIEHASMSRPDQIESFKRLGLTISSSASFLFTSGESYYYALGKRALDMFPDRSYVNNGIIAANNADSPCSDNNPMFGVYAQVARKTSGGRAYSLQERLTPWEALKSYTINAAYLNFDEKILGSIKEGKLADLVILSDNPEKIDVEQIKDIKVEMTMVNGIILYER